jgi:hypothetical protein
MEDDGDKPGPTGTLCRNSLGQATLRREQRERLECNHHDKQAQPSGRKERQHTDRLLETISLREVAMWHICSKQELWSQRNNRSLLANSAVNTFRQQRTHMQQRNGVFYVVRAKISDDAIIKCNYEVCVKAVNKSNIQSKTLSRVTPIHVTIL